MALQVCVCVSSCVCADVKEAADVLTVVFFVVLLQLKTAQHPSIQFLGNEGVSSSTGFSYQTRPIIPYQMLKE